MAAYYNEIKPEAVHMLKQLIRDGLIAPGDVDERSIVDVRSDDLKGYTQCHFFAGIGGWSVALRLAMWPDDRPVWTGSCPCQGHSTAGKRKGASDARNLWPYWGRLIGESKPATVFGEQVASAITFGWLDEVFNDLEAEAYSCAATVLPACSVGKPHKRDRIWFVGYAANECTTGGHYCDAGCGKKNNGKQPVSEVWMQDANKADGLCGSGSTMGDSKHNGSYGGQVAGSEGSAIQHDSEGAICADQFEGTSESRDVADTECGGRQGSGALGQSLHTKAGSDGQASQFIDDSAGLRWIECPDGKSRPVKHGIRLLAHGVQHRAPILHALGNAIVPQVAAEFIKATM